MDYTNQELKNKMFHQIREALPSEVKILYICLTGSQGKNMASAESDYDVRVIIQNPFESYILQRPRQNILIKTELDGKELEGQSIDITKALEYAVETNAFMVDVLRGIPMYCESKELIDELKRVFHQGFLPIVPINAFQGMLFHYFFKELRVKPIGKEKGQERAFLEQVPVKSIVECIFLILEIRCVLGEKDILEYFNIENLLSEFGGRDEELMRPLIELRRTDRKRQIPVSEEIKELINKTLASVDEFKDKFSKEKKQMTTSNRSTLKTEIDRICLDLICGSKL